MKKIISLFELFISIIVIKIFFLIFRSNILEKVLIYICARKISTQKFKKVSWYNEPLLFLNKYLKYKILYFDIF